MPRTSSTAAFFCCRLAFKTIVCLRKAGSSKVQRRTLKPSIVDPWSFSFLDTCKHVICILSGLVTYRHVVSFSKTFPKSIFFTYSTSIVFKMVSYFTIPRWSPAKLLGIVTIGCMHGLLIPTMLPSKSSTYAHKYS